MLTDRSRSSSLLQERNRRSSLRNREFNSNRLGEVLAWESRSNLNRDLKLEGRKFLDIRIDSEGSLKFSSDSIVHDQEFSVRRLDCDRFHTLEISSIHTFVEGTVIYDSSSTVALSQLKVLIEDKSEFWVSFQIRFHLDNSINGRVDECTIRVEQTSQLVKDIDKDLLFGTLLRSCSDCSLDSIR